MQNLFYNVTGEQVLYFDNPTHGRPDSVTSVTVFAANTGDDGSSEACTTGSASIDSVDTTFDDSAGDGNADPTLLPLASTTGIAVGRTYRATNAAGESETVEVHAVNAGASVLARHPLRNSYTTGDLFEGTRMSISVDDTWIADTANISDDLNTDPGYRVRWEYVVNSVTHLHASYFNVVRYRAGHTLLPSDIDNKRPGWLNNLPVEHIDDRGRILIDDAYSDFKYDVHRMGVPAEMLRDVDVVNYLTKLRVLMNTTHNDVVNGGDPTGYDLDRDAYQAALQGLIPKTSIAGGDSGAGGTRVPMEIWEK